MRNTHVWDLLALQVPNLLPKSVFGSHFPRKGGRLIWATVIFVIGLAIAFATPNSIAQPLASSFADCVEEASPS